MRCVCECPCVKRFFFSPALPPADPHPPTPLWLRRRSGATQRRASDAKPRSNPSVYLGLEARPQPLPLLSPKDLRQTFIYWPPASVPQPRPLSSGRPLPAPLSQCERICMEQQSVLPGQWPVGDGTGPLTAAVCSGTHGFRRMWPSVGVGGERGAAPAWWWQGLRPPPPPPPPPPRGSAQNSRCTTIWSPFIVALCSNEQTWGPENAQLSFRRRHLLDRVTCSAIQINKKFESIL